MATRRRARELTPAELRERRARDAERKRRARGTRSRDTAVDEPVDDAGHSRDTSRDSAGQDRGTFAGHSRDNSSRDDDRKGVVVPRSEGNETRDTRDTNGSRDTEDADLGARWPDGRVPLEPARVKRLAELHDRRARARDAQAIAACGMCDAHGFVVLDPGDGHVRFPLVAWCSHMTTARAERSDLA